MPPQYQHAQHKSKFQICKYLPWHAHGACHSPLQGVPKPTLHNTRGEVLMLLKPRIPLRAKLGEKTRKEGQQTHLCPDTVRDQTPFLRGCLGCQQPRSAQACCLHARARPLPLDGQQRMQAAAKGLQPTPAIAAPAAYAVIHRPRAIKQPNIKEVVQVLMSQPLCKVVGPS